ncbi:MAG: hypothetical protein WD994_06765, partial [Pseudomonadales bacterium]
MLKNNKLQAWIDDMAALCEPREVVICDGSTDEYNRMWDKLVASGAARQLNPELRPNSYLVRSDPADVARVESRTFICSDEKIDAGPTNNWVAPDEMRTRLSSLFKGC